MNMCRVQEELIQLHCIKAFSFAVIRFVARVTNNSLNTMELFKLDDLLSQMKTKLMSGTKETQMWVAEQILTYLKKTIDSEREHLVEKLVKCDIISIICDAMQMTCSSDKKFVTVVLECLEIISFNKKFYENRTAMSAINSMLSINYFAYTSSLKDMELFEEILQGICNILVRSLKLAIDFDTVCVPQQIISFLKNLNIQDLQNDKMKFIVVTILNVVLQQVTVDETIDVQIIIDVSCDALKSMIIIIKYGDDDNTILRSTALLCSICAGSSRFCFEQKSNQSEILQQKNNLLICIYDALMNIIIPYVKDADLSRIESNEFCRNFIFCLNNLYQLENCNHDDLSNYLVANGYLKYFLLLTLELPENLRRNICILLSQILSILCKREFSIKDKNEFAYCLRKDFLNLISKSSTKERWNDAVASDRNGGTALLILPYYHFQGTGEYKTSFFYITLLFRFYSHIFYIPYITFRNDVISLESLITRIMLFSTFKPISVLVLKPLWFLFAVTSTSHQSPNSIRDYNSAVIRLTNILQKLEISNFYTHHIDLLYYYLKCSNVSQNLLSQILNLWLIESDGDIKPLLSFNCEKVVRHLLIVIRNGYPEDVISAAMKGLRHLIQIDKNDKHIVEQIAETAWHMLPNILSLYDSNTVTHVKAALELANITQDHSKYLQIMPSEIIIRCAYNIVDIILKKNTDLKFMTLAITQAHILLLSDKLHKSFKVLQIYTQPMLLKQLYVYGFSKERSKLSTISIKLLTFIIQCQEKSSIKCKQPLKIHIKSLLDLLFYARKSSTSVINEMQFICYLLTQNIDKSAIVLEKISSADVDMVKYLYQVFHIIHAMKHEPQRDTVYQSLIVLLHFCNTKVTIKTLLPHICSVMSNYYLILNVVKTRYVSCQFIEFVTTWLNYRKATCNDVLWNPRSLFKSPFDEVLDHLKEYAVMLNNKGLKDAYENLQRALSQFQ
ncbi:LOW QUALITY PROTEIN: uncharacterized protein [Anoplolepis gracilipes]|uniref:LOW QUALITY PROTEIN: uncharacterized protein n=1 Tax=Anoplolepis gracilipes TaxID=354296 RepID=UPI003BA12B94